MNCAGRNCVYALIGLFVWMPSLSVSARDNVNTSNVAMKFQWREHAKLSWDDFKGVVNTTHDESAAATCCSIGFKTNLPANGGKPEIEVYNTFYADKSWVKSDARIQSILDHEQGHFDLCEIYTRKLKNRLDHFDLRALGVKELLMREYAELSKEYEIRQQAYELETIHGTNLAEQKRWQDMIARELM